MQLATKNMWPIVYFEDFIEGTLESKYLFVPFKFHILIFYFEIIIISAKIFIELKLLYTVYICSTLTENCNQSWNSGIEVYIDNLKVDGKLKNESLNLCIK